jgi:hypothetical protein
MLITGQINRHEPVWLTPRPLAETFEFLLSHVRTHMVIKYVIYILQVLWE